MKWIKSSDSEQKVNKINLSLETEEEGFPEQKKKTILDYIESNRIWKITPEFVDFVGSVIGDEWKLHRGDHHLAIHKNDERYVIISERDIEARKSSFIKKQSYPELITKYVKPDYDMTMKEVIDTMRNMKSKWAFIKVSYDGDKKAFSITVPSHLWDEVSSELKMKEIE